jgi:outer membrane protein assembly factor BamB
VYALDAATGEIEWETPEYSGRPTLSDGMVYVDSGSSLVALDRDSGDLQWKFTEPTDSLFPPTVNNDTVYVGSKDNTLYAVDTMTGSKKWEFTNASHHVRTPTIVETPDGGDSVGSRVNLGLFGHHHVWAESSVTSEEGDSDTDDTNVLDNVSDGSIAEYTDYINNYSVTGERSYTGDYAITAVGGDNAFLADDGEIGTVSQGTIFSMRAYLESSAAEVGILFGVQSEGRKNWYNAEYKAPQNRLAIFRDNETRPTETVANKNGVELPAEEWLQFKITWDDGTLGGNSGDITFTIQRESGEVLHEIAGNNTFYTSGGIGYNNQADVAYYDYYRKHSTDMTEDPVNKYTDTDGYVDSEGLLDAGADYRNGEIDEDRLNEVASAFRSGEPLS